MLAIIGRNLSLTDAVLVLAAMQTVYFVGVVIVCTRRGSTPRFRRAARVTVGVAGVLVAVVWWWINRPVEGSTLLSLSNSHSITVGDLLSVPALVVAAVVGVGGRVDRP